MAALSQLYVEFRASTDKLNSDLRAAQREIKQFEKAWAPTISILETIGTAAAAAGAAIVGTLIASTKVAADYGDKIRDAGIQTGLTTQMMAGLKVMAEQNGSSLEEMSNGLKFLAKNFVAATEGGKQQAEAFEKLGISTAELKDAHGNLEPVMRKVMDRLKEMPNGANKTAIELTLMGKSAVGLTEAMSQGSEALDNYISLTKLLGTDVTPEAAAAADKFNDALNILGQSFLGFNNSVGNALIPAMTVTVDIMTAAVVTAKDYVVQIIELGNAAAATANAFYGSGGLGTALGGVLSLIPGGNKIFADLAVNYEKLQASTTAATHLQKMFSDALGKTDEDLKKNAESAKKLADTLNKASLDSLKFAMKGESAERDLLDRQLDYHTKIYEEETKVRIDEINKQLKAIKDVEDLIFDAKVRSSKLAADAEKDMRDDLDRNLDYHTKIYEDEDKERAASRDKTIKKISDEEQRAAESYQRMWEQATASVTSDFVNAFSDVIFHAKNFGDAMKDIAVKTAESMFKAFLTGLLAPLTSELSKLGAKLGSILMGGGAGGSGGGGIGGVLGGVFGGGSGGSGGGGGGGTTGGAIGSGVGGLISGAFSGMNIADYIQAAETVRQWVHAIGAGRRAADEIVKSQNAIWASIATDFNARNTSSLGGLIATKQRIQTQFDEWQKNVTAFAASDPNNQKVANQAFATLGPQLANLMRELDANIQAQGGVPGANGTIDLQLTASQKFSDAVDRIVPAFDSFVGVSAVAPSDRNPITVNNDYNPTFTFYGVPESLEKEVRDTIEPALMSDFANNTRGLTAQLVTILENARNGVTNQIPATV